MFEIDHQGASIEVLEAHLAEHAGDAAGWVALGIKLRSTGRPEEAIACHRRALDLQPRHVGAWTSLGNALKDADRLEEAVAAQQKAVELAPSQVGILANLGIALREAKRLDEAIAVFDGAVELAPNNLSLRWDRAQCLLHHGEYPRGLADYEVRFSLPDKPLRHPEAPVWQGEALSGRALLLLGEQGFGDSILAARYIPLLRQAGARVLIGCRPELKRLFETLDGVEAVFAFERDRKPKFDFACPMMSLPARFGTTIETIPPPAQFRIPDEVREEWRHRLDRDVSGLRIGVIWSGSTTFAGNQRRAASLRMFLRLLEVRDVHLYSLQKGPPEAELQELAAKSLIRPLGPELTDFLETAAALEHLDLVVMTDSGTAHLAASLRRPVWNLLAFMPYWLYGPTGTTTPWYSSMRLFRQAVPGAWDAVFQEVADALGASGNAVF